MLKFTTDLCGVDLALFVIQVVSDFPEMPRLVRLLDGIPREKRVLVDLWGHYNDTIRLEHDFNHLEKLDGHQGWEWEEAIAAVSDTILQPTLSPLRPNVGSFLFHGFDPAAVVKPYATAAEAAAAWREATPAEKPYGVMYVGNNWQRWEQVRRFLEQYGPARAEVGKACLIGWDWGQRPEWAVKQGIAGIDTDPALLAELGVELRPAVRFDEVKSSIGQARFAPIFHRPLFRHLGLRDHPHLRDLRGRRAAHPDAAARLRRGDLRPGGADPGAGRRRGGAHEGRPAPSRALLASGAGHPGAPGTPPLVCAALPGA